MTARPKILILAASLALAPALLAQDHAVPRGGGGGGGSSGGGGEPPLAGRRAPAAAARSSSPGYSGGSSSGVRLVRLRRPPSAGTPAPGPGSGSRRRLLSRLPGLPRAGAAAGTTPATGATGGPTAPAAGTAATTAATTAIPGAGAAAARSTTASSRRAGRCACSWIPPRRASTWTATTPGTVDDFDGLFQRLNVSPGRHEIALKLEGYKTHRMRVYVAPDSTLKLHYELEKGMGETLRGPLRSDAARARGAARREEQDDDRWSENEARVEKDELTALGGRLELSIRPEDASVYVDGAFRGSAREASTLRLAPGRHRIEIVQARLQDARAARSRSPRARRRSSALTLERGSILERAAEHLAACRRRRWRRRRRRTARGRCGRPRRRRRGRCRAAGRRRRRAAGRRPARRTRTSRAPRRCRSSRPPPPRDRRRRSRCPR